MNLVLLALCLANLAGLALIVLRLQEHSRRLDLLKPVTPPKEPTIEPKRPRGRPRKVPVTKPASLPEYVADSRQGALDVKQP